ncbi:MAG: serine hydrolase [Planctomycetaceae bacterium]|nr:serine hydrolase [Planctomycetaceae bacterium]
MVRNVVLAAWLVVCGGAGVLARSEPAWVGHEQPVASAVDRESELAEAIDALAAKYLAMPGGVGLSVAVARGDRMLVERGYGLADVEFDVLANAQTCFRIGSVTKQFTAALVLRCAEEGKLSLEDELSKFVPSFPLQGRKVTIRQLLNHTSGIVSYTDLDEEWHSKWPLELSHEELLALVKDKPFVFEPGTKWAYNNTGYYLLGMVLESVRGKPYAEIVREELATPLGLGRTRYDSNVELIKNRAQGYSFEGGKLANDQILGMNQPGAAGALVSTAGELVRWQQALAHGKVVSAASFAQMTTPTVLPDAHDTGYGFGLSIDDLDGVKRVQHGGGIFGFNSMLAWFPDSDVHVAVISNGEPINSGRLADEIARLVLDIKVAPLLDLPIAPERLQQLAGRFKIELIGLSATVTARDGKLFLQGDGQGEFRLQHQGGDVFRAAFDDTLRIEFAADGKSFTLRQGSGLFPARRIE